ncbi:MAG TPA: AI-2E family transporter [Acetivibrio sp.]|nr:AI-2E family transporter [Acetivibrio sp.]HPT91551.1 AI-2E family transporter [Acetivibrio sp.]
MWYNHKFFKFGSAILLILLIIYMLGQIDFFLEPFRKLVASIFTPLLISTLLYYVLRPLVNLLEKIKVRRTFGILLSFAAVLVLFVVLSTYTGTIIVEQFNQLLKDLPTFDIAWEKNLSFLNSDWLESLPLDKFQDKLIDVLKSVPENLKTILLGIVSTVTNIGTLIFMIPFILFYFLKDDKYFLSNVISHIPVKYRDNAGKIIKDVDTTLSSYITGQMLIALFVGIMMFIGYLIIGMKYSFLLGIFAMVSSLIPFFGPTIGIIPALLLSLATNDLLMFAKVIAVMVIVQQIDNNFISPYIMGQRLNVHPVTVILLITVGASLYGFLGLFLAVPLYAAAKVSAKNLYDIYRKYKLKEASPK